MVNRRPRKRVCVDGMVALVRELNLPAGTVADLEVGGGRSAYNSQTSFVQGAASGTWHGVPVSHDFDVRLVAASTWKWALKLARRGAPRDKNESLDLAKRLLADVADVADVADLLRLQKYHARPPASHARRRPDQRSCVLRPRARPIVTRRSCARKRNQNDQGRSEQTAGRTHFFQTKKVYLLFV